jgi:PAS domain S-box-containing protein
MDKHTNSDSLTIAALTKRVADLEARERQLQRDYEYLRQLYERAPLGYHSLDSNGCILEVNQAWLNNLGYTREEVVGRHISDFIHPDWLQHLKNNFQRFKAAGEIFGVEYVMLRKDGSTLRISLDGNIGKDPEGNFQQTHCIFHDITERKLAETALQQSEQEAREAKALLELILDTIPVRLFWKDRDANYLGCNRLFAQDAGYQNPEDVIGQNDYTIGWNDQSEMYRRDDFDVMASKQPKLHYEEMQTTPDGRLIWVSTSKVPIFDAQGEVMGVLGTYEDITQRKRQEEELKAAHDDLERRVEQRTGELQETQKQYMHAEKLAAIGKLSASIAHEFNNPLQGVLAVLQGVKKRAILEPEDAQLVDAAIAESDRMKNLIRSLQDFNRPSLGKKVVMDVHKSLDAVLLLQRSDFKNRGIAVTRDYAEQLPQIIAISDQIKQVFLNLLTNAADACQQSGGVITVSTWQEDDRVAVAIKDTGVGIDPERIEMIFQPFYTTKAEVKGTGLGLSVSYGIIKRHQGEIRVDSHPGHGTTFTVLLPIKGDSGGNSHSHAQDDSSPR